MLNSQQANSGKMVKLTRDMGDIIQKGGIYALIGPTGAGKTTTVAKLAAQAILYWGANSYGENSVVLLTTDSYGIGAYEQIKIYGKILGVSVHAVKGAEDLRLTLAALRHKHLVLIDTMGMGQRDERVSLQKQMFDTAGVHSLLLLNAGSSGDTLDEVVCRFRSDRLIGCIVTKLDEAVDLNVVQHIVDRHKLTVYGTTDGPRVPEDFHHI